jgi:hypothetical protein
MDVIDHSSGCPRADLTYMSLGPADVGTLVSKTFARRKRPLSPRAREALELLASEALGAPKHAWSRVLTQNARRPRPRLARNSTARDRDRWRRAGRGHSTQDHRRRPEGDRVKR